jgi:hypothetical protein
VSEIIAAYLMPPIESGSVDFAEFEPQLVYWFCRKFYPRIIFPERQVGAFSLRGFEWRNAGWLRLKRTCIILCSSVKYWQRKAWQAFVVWHLHVSDSELHQKWAFRFSSRRERLKSEVVLILKPIGKSIQIIS